MDNEFLRLPFRIHVSFLPINLAVVAGSNTLVLLAKRYRRVAEKILADPNFLNLSVLCLPKIDIFTVYQLLL